MFSVLYNISLLLIYFIHSSLYFLIPYPYRDPPLSPWVNTSLFSIPVSLFLLCYINLLFVFHVKVASYKILSFFVWYFTKHNILQVHPSCCNWKNFILFYTWVICNIPVYICVCMYKYIQILLCLLFYVFLCHEWSMSPTSVLIAAAATIMQVSEQELLLSFKNFFFLFLYSSLARWSNS